MCQPWCRENRHDLEPAGSVLHQGTLRVVRGFNECGRLQPLTIRALHLELPADWPDGLFVAELQRPYIEVHDGRGTLSLTAGQARAYAAALVATADELDATNDPNAR
jgi:hypothetical protein